MDFGLVIVDWNSFKLIMPSSPPVLTTTLIAPGSGGVLSSFAECWRHRELLCFLGWREIKVRYKQTVLGVAWAGLQPLVTMAVFTLIFHRMAGIGTGEVPYALFAFAGLLPWTLFQNVMERSSTSLVQESGLVTKVYFPRLLLPLSKMAIGLVDFSISLILLFIMMGVYRQRWSLAVLALPFLGLFAALSAASVAVWLAALNARYRDITHLMPFLLRIWLFLSPVAYPSEALLDHLPRWFGSIYYLNPMTGVIEAFRWALLGQPMNAGLEMASSFGMVILLLWTGLLYFRKTERVLADVL